MRAVLDGYADRPALGQRAVEFVGDADGRTTTELLPRFDTVTYGQLCDRVRAIAAALHDQPVRVGDRVAILGFTSVDYTVVDIALTQLGAVSVPLQTSAPQAQLQPIVAETEPSLIATSIDYVADAVALTRAGHAPARLVVFDYRPEVDDHREALQAAKAALADTSVVVETLGDVLERGRRSSRTHARLRRRRRTRAAGLHLRQHRRPEGCDLPGEQGRQHVAGAPRTGTGTTSRACCPRSR